MVHRCRDSQSAMASVTSTATHITTMIALPVRAAAGLYTGSTAAMGDHVGSRRLITTAASAASVAAMTARRSQPALAGPGTIW